MWPFLKMISIPPPRQPLLPPLILLLRYSSFVLANTGHVSMATRATLKPNTAIGELVTLSDWLDWHPAAALGSSLGRKNTGVNAGEMYAALVCPCPCLWSAFADDHNCQNTTLVPGIASGCALSWVLLFQRAGLQGLAISVGSEGFIGLSRSHLMRLYYTIVRLNAFI